MKRSPAIVIAAIALALIATVGYVVASRQFGREAAQPIQVQAQPRPAQVVTRTPPKVVVKAPAANEVAEPSPPSVPVVAADDAAQVAEDAAAVGMTTVESEKPAAAPVEPHDLDASKEIPVS